MGNKPEWRKAANALLTSRMPLKCRYFLTPPGKALGALGMALEAGAGWRCPQSPLRIGDVPWQQQAGAAPARQCGWAIRPPKKRLQILSPNREVLV